ncbi:MAG: hypothetical protein ACKVT0_17475 [Planctomycetaceae bacterium]
MDAARQEQSADAKENHFLQEGHIQPANRSFRHRHVAEFLVSRFYDRWMSMISREKKWNKQFARGSGPNNAGATNWQSDETSTLRDFHHTPVMYDENLYLRTHLICFVLFCAGVVTGRGDCRRAWGLSYQAVGKTPGGQAPRLMNQSC